MDLGKYLKKKKKGLVSLQRLGNTTVMVIRVFDRETGEELTPHTFPVSSVELSVKRGEIEASLKGLDALLSDIKELEATKVDK